MSASTPLGPLRVEQVMTYLRVFGLLAGLLAILLAAFPDAAHTRLAWGIEVVLLLGTVGLALWRHHLRPGDGPALQVGGFVVDALVICGYVLAFTHLRPNVAWVMVFTLLADAALRFGVRGAALGFGLSAVLYVLQAWAYEMVTGVATPAASYVYVIGTLAGAAGVLAVFTVTLERQARAARQQALDLADANRVRERLLAMVSHEFRGSLAAMTLAANTVRDNLARLGPQRAAGLLGEVDRHGRYLNRLVEDLVAVARASSDTAEVSRRWDDLPASVETALAAAARHRDGHHLTVSVEPVACEVDHERLQQVVRNLVENAYKYTPSHSGVTVTARHEGTHLLLRVADDGPGIPAAERDRVFEPFTRRAAAGRGDSAGLGLYVVQQVVTAMGGSLDLRTSSGGTEFVVRVPAEVSPQLRSVPGGREGAARADNGWGGVDRARTTP
jgi:signal transduction histidine kinase